MIKQIKNEYDGNHQELTGLDLDNPQHKKLLASPLIQSLLDVATTFHAGPSNAPSLSPDFLENYINLANDEGIEPSPENFANEIYNLYTQSTPTTPSPFRIEFLKSILGPADGSTDKIDSVDLTDIPHHFDRRWNRTGLSEELSKSIKDTQTADLLNAENEFIESLSPAELNAQIKYLENQIGKPFRGSSSEKSDFIIKLLDQNNSDDSGSFDYGNKFKFKPGLLYLTEAIGKKFFNSIKNIQESQHKSSAEKGRMSSSFNADDTLFKLNGEDDVKHVINTLINEIQDKLSQESQQSLEVIQDDIDTIHPVTEQKKNGVQGNNTTNSSTLSLT